MSTASRGDIAPLRHRMGALFVLRVGLAAAVLTTSQLLPRTAGASLARLAPLVAGYLLVVVALEVARQWRDRLPRRVMGASVLADGVFMAAVLTLTGGPGTPLSFLLYVHLVAVTLLGSYRTGLKIAVWQSLLLVVVYYLPDQVAGVAGPSRDAAVFGVVTFLAVALVTAACSALNERELRRSRAGFRALADMAAEMDQLQHPDDVLAVLLRAVRDYMGGTRAAVVLPRRVTVLDGDRVVAADLPPGTGPDATISRCLATRGPVLVAELDATGDGVLRRALPAGRNLVVVPFAADGEIVGVLAVEKGAGAGGLRASVLGMVSQFATHAALAHRNVRLLAEIQHLATVDALTGLANRRTFEDTLAREVARGVRTGAPLSLLLVDVDHFKQVNDIYGHPVGDEALRRVGQVLSTHGREEDLPARYGGEEFAVILPGCPPEEALGVAERLRNGIAGITSPVAITASVGAASLHRNAMDAEGLIKAADTALYEAKAAGRNRTVAATTTHLRPVRVA